MMSHMIIGAALVTRTALHVGGGRAAEGIDALLRRNAAGQIFIPGSAVGGPLRALATRLAPRLGSMPCRALLADESNSASSRNPRQRSACQCVVCRLFGAVDPQEENSAQGGAASHLWIYDAVAQDARPTRVRDGVGIERRTGAAARSEALKYNLEVLPAGVTFSLRLKVQDADDEEIHLLAATLGEWVAGRASLGGRVSRGMGAFDISDLTVEALKLDEAATLLAYLKEQPGAGFRRESGWFEKQIAAARTTIKPLSAVNEAVHSYVAASFLQLELEVQATGPFIANDPTAAQLANVDHAPLIEGRPILPGASLRGVLRSHAERIARTLTTNTVSDLSAFRRTCPACDTGARRDQAPLRACDALLADMLDPLEEARAGQLCLACQLFGSARWGSRLIVEDAPLAEGTAPIYKMQDFLAIDRFTGGGRHNAKFDALVLWQPRFTARLRLENPQAWELGWLALTLRDLAEGWLPLGFGAAKGFGKVNVPKWNARLGFIQAADLPLTVDSLQAAVKDAPVAERSIFTEIAMTGAVNFSSDGRRPSWSLHTGSVGTPAAWQQQAAKWVADFNAAVQGFDRVSEEVPLLPPADTYFGAPAGRGQHVLPELYPPTKEVRIDGRA